MQARSPLTSARWQQVMAILSIMAFLLAALPTPTAQAKPLAAGTLITVTTTTDDVTNNGNCSLREAIAAANGNAAVDACPAGSSTAEDIIVLTSGQTYSLTISGDLNILDSAGLKIQANGTSLATVQANNSNRIFDVANNASLTLDKIKVTGGSNVGSGAGIRLGVNTTDTASLTLIQSEVSGNTATTDTNCGAGISISGTATVQILESLIANNTCTEATIGGHGAGLYVRDGNVTIRNSTFYGNTTVAGKGGGIYISAGTVTIAFSTFSNNSAASGSGNGLHRNSTTPTLSVTSSIFANSLNGPDCFSAGTAGETFTNNLIENNAASTDGCGTPAFTADPGLGALQDNGGPTPTMAITAASPAFNAASSCTGSNGSDQRGILRPQDAGCDLGAYELVVGGNNPPTDINLSNSSVAENQPANTTVGTLSTTDPDAGESFTYALVSNGIACPGAVDNASFSITGSTLKTAATFDYETKNSYTICVRSYDHVGMSFDKQFTISVTNVNEAPVVNAATFSLNENSANGTAVGTVTFSDPDNGQSGSFSIISGNTGGAFAINASSGQITVNNSAALNYEATPTFHLTVQVTDNGTPPASGSNTITINLNDVNEAPTDISLSNNTVAENQPINTVIGTLSTTDPDSGNIFTYSLVNGGGSCPGTDNASFNINGNQLRTSAAFNYEAKNSYVICVRSTDQGSLSVDKPFTITILNLNEAPTDISLSNNTVAENQPANTVVGTFSTTDPDAGNTFTYSLVANGSACPGAVDNASFNISGANLRTSAPFDYESKNSYVICVRTSDQGGLTFDEQFIISVTNANDAPVVNAATFSIDENRNNGTNVGTVTVSDQDGGQSHTFAITGGNTNGAFAINASTGQITVANKSALDYETNPVFHLTVQATDNGAPPLSGSNTITINLNDVNEAPVVSAATFSVDENSANGTVVGTVSASDPDAGQTLTYSIQAGDPNGAFAINASTGQITVANGSLLDYETTPSYSLTVRATDNASSPLFGEATITINLNNVIEIPGAFGKVDPANGATSVSIAPTLSWGASNEASDYEYCVDTTNDNACDGNAWQSAGANTSVALSGLSYATTYYWQVRANNVLGTTEADGGTWWSFTTQFYPTTTLTLLSVGTQDGWILEYGENSNVGGTLNATATTFYLGDDAQDRQYRAILSFNTAALPDNAVITKVTLKIKRQGIVGINPFTTHGKLAVDIRKGAFGVAALQTIDFNAAASKNGVAQFSSTPQAGNWYVANLNATAFSFVNKTGTTQFRLRFTKDDNDDMGADYLKFFSGNAALAYRPMLIIEYYVP